MFKNLFRKKRDPGSSPAEELYAGARKEATTTQVRFQKAVCPVPRKISTQDGERTVEDWTQVESALEDMLSDGDQFVVLSAGDPRYGILFVQTTPSNQGDGFIVQLSLADGSKSRLVEKICSWKECRDIFREYYGSTRVDGLETYKPVEFFT